MLGGVARTMEDVWGTSDANKVHGSLICFANVKSVEDISRLQAFMADRAFTRISTFQCLNACGRSLNSHVLPWPFPT